MRRWLLPLAFLAAAATAAAAPTNDVLVWNEIATDATLAAGLDPLTESRILAMVHLAMEASIENGGSAADAAHGVLVELIPGARETLDRELDGTEPGERAVTLGRKAASAILAARRNDGAERSVPYLRGGKPGEYRPTPPELIPAALPQWGGIKPFALASPAQFRPSAPYPAGSDAAAREIELVRAIGGAGSALRTAEQSEIARYWYESSPQGWNRIARIVALQRSLDVREAARLFALLNVAMADGFIAGFEAKYHYAYWRPVTAIREGGDSGWLPYLSTPPVPDHPSTHTVLGAAAATVLARFFGTDYVPFEMTSGAPYAGLTRRFYSFSDAARENGASRVFAGIHFPNAVADGYTLGEAVGDWAFDHAPKTK